MGMMTAALLTRFGGPEAIVYETIEELPLSPGDVRVRVAACALNARDVFTRRGLPGVTIPLPHILGGDVAGWVTDAADEQGEPLVGRPVLIDPLCLDYRGWKAGVFGEHHRGGLAEFMVAPAANAIPLDGLDAVELRRYSALPIAYGIAHQMLHERARLKAGETVLVLGDAGGVGMACVQLAKRVGARVIACSSSDDRLAALSRLGADEVINTAGELLGARTWELTGRRGADVVVDYLGHDTLASSVRAARAAGLTRPGGRIVIRGASSGFGAQLDLRYVWTKEIDIRGSNGWRRADLLDLIELTRTGELDPVIDLVVPLSEVHKAIAAVEERTVLGKVIVVPDTELGNRPD